MPVEEVVNDQGFDLLKMHIEKIHQDIAKIEKESIRRQEELREEVKDLSGKIDSLTSFRYKVIGGVVAVSMITSSVTSKVTATPPQDITNKIIKQIKEDIDG